MYSLQSASWVLGVSIRTVGNWIAKDNIETVMIEADRKRKYIADSDVILLSDKHCRKLGKLEKITKRKDNDQDQYLYTLVEVANFLGVSIVTVSRWLVEAGIEKMSD